MKFPVVQISLGVQNENFRIFHVSTISAFAEIFKSQENSKNKKNCRTREQMATRMLCFRAGVCVLVQLWPCLQFLFLVSCPARAHALLFFLFLCSCWCLGSLSLSFLFFSVSISVVSSLLRLALVGARPHPARESRDALLPPLPLTKKTLL